MSRPKTSLVFPIHNEEKYLPYSLRSLNECPEFDEIVFLMDRCADKSLELVSRFSAYRYNVKIIESNKTAWRNPIAEAFEKAFNHASGDILFSMASDIVTDPAIYDPEPFKRFDIMSFQYTTHSPDKISLHEKYVNLLGNLPSIYSCKYGKFSGHFAMRREMWKDLHFRDLRSPDLDFFNRAFEAGYTHKFSKSRTLHLRPGLNKEKQLGQAEHRFYSRSSPLRTLAHGALTLKPHYLAHYLKLKTKGR